MNDPFKITGPAVISFSGGRNDCGETCEHWEVGHDSRT